MRKTISEIIKRECCSCGLCEGVCASEAISFHKDEQGFYLPSIDVALCTKCGICYEICPGDKIEEVKLYQSLNQKIPENYIKGNCIECFNAKMVDIKMVEQCTSGGMVTGLISYLLNRKEYDVAFCVTTFDYSSQVKTFPIADNLDVEKTAQSRYITVSHSELAKYILRNRDKRIIIVAVGCAMTGIRTVFEKFKLDKSKYLCLGLFCACSYSYRTWDYFQLYDNDELKELQFRCKNGKRYAYGMVKARYGNKNKIMHTIHRAYIKSDFAMERCLLCTDLLNVFSDISFGDNNTKSKDGESCTVIVRTELGKNVVEKLESDKLFLRENIIIDDIKDIQGRRKRELYANMLEQLKGGSHIYKDRENIDKQEWGEVVREYEQMVKRRQWALNGKNIKKLWLINQIKFLKLRITNKEYLKELKSSGKVFK